MYSGYNIDIKNVKRDDVFDYYRTLGSQLFDEYTEKITPLLSDFMNSDKSLDGTGLQNTWFPLVEADVFISHSHKNLDLALFLAGWLNKKFGLKPFIDSCIWEYVGDLQNQIDKDHCSTGPGLFSYDLRNHSTSHVHMMLATAINMMMDKTESIFFINTPDAIRSYGLIDKTASPWIYAEVAATHFLRQRDPERKRIILEDRYSNMSGTESLEKAVDIWHEVDLSHLPELDLADLINWQNQLKSRIHSLDILYYLHPPKKP